MLTLDNGVVRRIIQVGADNHGIISKSYSLRKPDDEFLSTGSADFYFEADGKPLTGLDNWKPVNVKIIDGENNGNGAMVDLENPNSGLRISITYMLYPELPVIQEENLISEYRESRILSWKLLILRIFSLDIPLWELNAG